MMAYVPAPALRQGADEEVILEIGSILLPDCVQRDSDSNGLRLRIDGDYADEAVVKLAADQFQVLLGVLRAWRPVAGEREDEARPEIGTGPIRDERGNLRVLIGPAIAYATIGSEVRDYAHAAKTALAGSLSLRNALWLNGRRDRNASDCFMIYEYAKGEFGGDKRISAALGVSDNDITRLTTSANNLAPIAGGRHSLRTGAVEWDVPRQIEFISRFLSKWIEHRALGPA